MKYLFLLMIVMFSSSVGFSQTGKQPQTRNSYNSPSNFQSRPNIFGGQRYYSSGRPMGYSRPNIYGGQNYNSYNSKKK
jgi:hypothetical protein